MESKLKTHVDFYLIDSKQDLEKYLLRDEIFKGILGTGDLMLSTINISDSKWYVVLQDQEVVAITLLNVMGNNILEIHAGVYKPYRYKALDILQAGIQKLQQVHTGPITTTCNEHNIPAIKLVKAAGFKEQLRIKDGYKTGDLLFFLLEKQTRNFNE